VRRRTLRAALAALLLALAAAGAGAACLTDHRQIEEPPAPDAAPVPDAGAVDAGPALASWPRAGTPG